MPAKLLTEGNILSNIRAFALPYLVSYFLQLLYCLADLFIIGQFCGVEATTAVSIGSQVMHFLTVMIVGLTMGTTVLVARAIGAGDSHAAGKVVGNTATLFIAVSLAAALLLTLFKGSIVRMMATPEEAVEGAEAYLLICFAGLPFIAAYNVIASIFRGLGDSRSPMWFVIAACVANIVLDYLFIGAMDMGPEGAALGTTLSQLLSVLFALLWIRLKGLGIKLSKEDFRPSKKVIEGIFHIGLPVSLQDGFIQVAFLVITIIANMRGLVDSAAVGIVEKLIGMLFLVPSAMLSTVSTMGAQCLGANMPQRAKSTLGTALAITVSYGVIVAVLVQFFAEPLVEIFTASPEVIASGGEYFRSYAIDTVFAGCHFCFSGYFVAYGYSIVSFIHNTASVLIARLPLSYLLSVRFPETLYPMGLAAPAGSALSVLICLAFYIILRRKGKVA